MTAAGSHRRNVTAADVMEQWVLVQGAFHQFFHIELDDPEVRRSKTWKWFWYRVRYLLTFDNALSRHFAPKAEPPVEEVPAFDPSFDGS